MHVVIVGCGRVGSSLARNLVADGHTVAVIDRRAEAFERLGSDFPGRWGSPLATPSMTNVYERLGTDFVGLTLVGVGFDRDILLKAGIERAEAVAAVTNGDNSNILVARVARETFGIERVVARIYDPRRAAIYQRLGIATVAPALWTTERVMRRLLPDAGAVEWVDPSAKVSLVEREPGQAWVGHKVFDLETEGVRVMAVSRLGTAMLPTNELVVQEGDLLYFAVAHDALMRLDQLVVAPPSGHGH